MIEYKNPVLNITSNSIDCEINHPIHGWIPITLFRDSVNSDINMKELFDYIIENDSELSSFEEEINDDPNTKVFIL